MKDFLSNSVSGEILIVYSLIAIVLVLIITILYLDKREKKKKKDLFNNKFINTVKMKPIVEEVEMPAKETELRPIKVETKIQTETLHAAPVGVPKWVTAEIPVIDEKVYEAKEEITSIIDLEKVETKVEEPAIVATTPAKPEEVKSILEPVRKAQPKATTLTIATEEIPMLEEEDEVYIESDLEKTQAQIELEQLSEALAKAVEQEAIQHTKFEEIQEEEAIISYNELVKVCDRLYDENEKVQYMDEGNEPINLEELQRKFQRTITTAQEESPYESQVQIQDHVPQTVVRKSVEEKEEPKPKFHTTPFISPVYGIQKEVDDRLYHATPVHEKEVVANDY